jgi:hypothetical protein
MFYYNDSKSYTDNLINGVNLNVNLLGTSLKNDIAVVSAVANSAKNEVS